jgi:predicted nucleic acid-binding protein
MKTALLERFAGRILDLDAAVLLRWGTLTARLEAAGQPVPLMDALVAASALEHHLIVATRNTADFSPAGVELVNPWK